MTTELSLTFCFLVCLPLSLPSGYLAFRLKFHQQLFTHFTWAIYIHWFLRLFKLNFLGTIFNKHTAFVLLYNGNISNVHLHLYLLYDLFTDKHVISAETTHQQWLHPGGPDHWGDRDQGLGVWDTEGPHRGVHRHHQHLGHHHHHVQVSNIWV